MSEKNFLKNLEVPKGKIDVVLDTDAFNEIDDQFAISYLIKSTDKINVKAIYAAPFFNENSVSPKDGMEKSYDEILKLIDLAGSNDLTDIVFKGSEDFLLDEKTPVISEAAKHLAELAKNYSPQNPLYVVEIAAITTIASALLINPEIAENIVVVWLGGHALSFENTAEFNMVHDIAAARVIFKSDVALVQLPCFGVVDIFRISKPELLEWFKGKNKLCDYLAENSISAVECYAAGKPWTRVIWDVTAVAWLLNDDDKFMKSKIIGRHIPNYDSMYNIIPEDGKFMRYVYSIERDALMEDLINKLTKN